MVDPNDDVMIRKIFQNYIDTVIQYIIFSAFRAIFKKMFT